MLTASLFAGRVLWPARWIDAKRLTTTCGSGITTALVSLALELAGAAQVSLYDGSWAEYAAQPQAKIERSDAP